MSKGMEDPIVSELKKYEQDPDRNGKKAILLTPQGGYFLYGNRFCSITSYELEFYSASLQIQGKTVPETLFFNIPHFYAAGKQLYHPTLVSLIFQIYLDKDEPLRGILLAQGKEAAFSLFSDEATEALYRLSRKIGAHSDWTVPPDDELQQYTEKLRQNDLRWLANLYLKGEQLKSLPVKDLLSGHQEG